MVAVNSRKGSISEAEEKEAGEVILPKETSEISETEVRMEVCREDTSSKETSHDDEDQNGSKKRHRDNSNTEKTK